MLGATYSHGDAASSSPLTALCLACPALPLSGWGRAALLVLHTTSPGPSTVRGWFALTTHA